MKKDMSLEGLRWSCDSGSALYDTPPNGRSRTGWGGERGLRFFLPFYPFTFLLFYFYKSGENKRTNDSAKRCMNGRFRSPYTL
jgi:hypothetical protein